MSRKILHFLMLAALVAVSSVALADVPARVGRVTVTEGKVTMLVNGEEETGNLMNWPVTTDNHLTTAPGARAEFRIGSAAVRLDGDSDIEVEQLDDERLRLRLNYGTASVRIRDGAMLQEFELTTPQARVVLVEPGTVRVDTERAPDTTVVSVLAGGARVDGAGSSLTARAGKRIEVRGDDIFTGLAQRDRFDDWVATRDRRDEGLVASRYVPTDMTGYEDLDHYGNWVEDREYGTVWFPRAVPVGWAPYRDGRWVWVSPWGWTWVDNSPWGYAPFHYGRWVVVGGRWCWTPGRVVGRPVWSPALVGWVGGSNWSVSFGAGRSGPAVGWYPLTPRDRYVPSYRIKPDYERHLVWQHRTNDRWHDRWKDRGHDGRRDGVTALPREQFDRGRRISVTNVARVAPAEVRNVPQMVAPTPVVPQRPLQPRFDRGGDRGPDRVGRDEREDPRVLRPEQRQVIRTDNDDRDIGRGPNMREQQRRSVTVAPQAPQPQQGMLGTTPPGQFRAEQQRGEQPRFEQRREQPRMDQPRMETPREQPRFEPRMEPRAEQPRMEQPRNAPQRFEQPRNEQPRAEQPRNEPRFEQPRETPEPRFRRGDDGRPAPVQMAPARPVQIAPPPQQQAQPQAQPQPQAQQPRQREERRDERKEERREDRFR